MPIALPKNPLVPTSTAQYLRSMPPAGLGEALQRSLSRENRGSPNGRPPCDTSVASLQTAERGVWQLGS
jgi:hypothetical protein